MTDNIKGWGLLTVFCMVAVLTVSSLTGCSATTGIEGTSGVSQNADGDMQTSNFVIINNQKLARRLQIVDLRSSFAGDLMKANVTLVSKYSKTLNFKYKFAWFDAAGNELDPNGKAWQPLIMYGNESKTLQSVAPNPAAKEFKIKLSAN